MNSLAKLFSVSNVKENWHEFGMLQVFRRLRRPNYEGRSRKHEPINKSKHGQQGQKMIAKQHNNSSV